jgi:aspartyl-tRNA(Asn)/glutamyl-tRNA(Gln) amidotransferase subunit C
MTEISEKTVQHIAGLAHIALDPEETEHLQRDLANILGYFEALQSVDTQDTAPLSHISESPTPWREDQPEPCLPREAVFFGAPDVRDGLFHVPRILSEG